MFDNLLCWSEHIHIIMHLHVQSHGLKCNVLLLKYKTYICSHKHNMGQSVCITCESKTCKYNKSDMSTYRHCLPPGNPDNVAPQEAKLVQNPVIALREFLAAFPGLLMHQSPVPCPHVVIEGFDFHHCK